MEGLSTRSRRSKRNRELRGEDQGLEEGRETGDQETDASGTQVGEVGEASPGVEEPQEDLQDGDSLPREEEEPITKQMVMSAVDTRELLLEVVNRLNPDEPIHNAVIRPINRLIEAI